jgi:hypothetical protein
MARYQLSFDGRWQRSFRRESEALEWARLVSETGRLVHVVRRGIVWDKLIAVFPEHQIEEGKRLWKVRHAGSGFDGPGP